MTPGEYEIYNSPEKNLSWDACADISSRMGAIDGPDDWHLPDYYNLQSIQKFRTSANDNMVRYHRKSIQNILKKSNILKKIKR